MTAVKLAGRTSWGKGSCWSQYFPFHHLCLLPSFPFSPPCSILPAPRKEYEVYSDALEQPAARGGAGGQYAAAGAGRPGSKVSSDTDRGRHK